MLQSTIKLSRTIISSQLINQTSRRYLSCTKCNPQVLAPLTHNERDRQNISKSTLLLQNVHKRNYSIGDYDKLWQSVSSGRGKGRSGKKKTKPKEIDGEFLKFGSANMTFPGLNEPIKIQKPDPERKASFQRFKDKSYDEQRGPRRFQLDPSQRGWSGTSWPGRHAGAPQLSNGENADDFDSIVIEVKKVSVTRASGKRKRTSAIVVVGNKKGSIGWAIGKATFASAAIRKARNKAVNYLHYIPVCEGGTIYHNLKTKVKSTEVIFERKVPGYGRRCQRIVRAITELAGIENIRCKIVGRTTPLTLVRATFEGLQMQETHEELAERTGKYVVEYRKEKGNIPIIVSTPSNRALTKRLNTEEEEKNKEEDITTYFDPYRGAHRPKNLKEIKGTHPDLMKDI